MLAEPVTTVSSDSSEIVFDNAGFSVIESGVSVNQVRYWRLPLNKISLVFCRIKSFTQSNEPSYESGRRGQGKVQYFDGIAYVFQIREVYLQTETRTGQHRHRVFYFLTPHHDTHVELNINQHYCVLLLLFSVTLALFVSKLDRGRSLAGMLPNRNARRIHQGNQAPINRINLRSRLLSCSLLGVVHYQ